MRRPLQLALCTTVLALLPATYAGAQQFPQREANAETPPPRLYRWVDTEGVVHYTANRALLPAALRAQQPKTAAGVSDAQNWLQQDMPKEEKAETTDATAAENESELEFDFAAEAEAESEGDAAAPSAESESDAPSAESETAADESAAPSAEGESAPER